MCNQLRIRLTTNLLTQFGVLLMFNHIYMCFNIYVENIKSVDIGSPQRWAYVKGQTGKVNSNRLICFYIFLCCVLLETS